MSTYQELRGLKVKYLAANPDPGSKGDVWYDSATFELKGFVGRAAWSAGANMIVGRYNQGGAGTQTAAFVAGGAVTPDAVTDDTYEYNGVGWSTGEDMAGTDRLTTACGTLTAGLAAGGWSGTANVADSEEYDGTDWAEGDNLNTARRYGGQFGIQTAAVLVSGATGVVAVTEEYNGSAWANGEDCNTAMEHIGAAGTLTAGLKNGGVATAASGATEEYDGTDWTSVNSMNTARRADATFGTQTAAIAAGGYTTTAVASVEEYDGTSWTEIADLAAATNYGSGVGTNLAGMHTGGMPGYKTATEEFNNSFEVVTAGAWASMTNFPDTRAYAAASGGTPTSTLVFGGYDGAGLGGFVSSGAEWDGSSWTGTGDYPIDVAGVAGLGPVTAGLGCGGYKDNATNVTTTAEYDGSSWTAGNNANVVGQGAKMAGTQTAGSMGNRSGDENGHEQYNGSTWTAATDTPVAGSAGAMMAGTQSALLMYGGEASNKKRTESWDGSSWTSLTDMAFDRRQGAHGGTQTIAIAGGGDSNPGVIANTELWDGTSWVSGPNMATARFYQVGGTSTGSGVTSCIAATGRPASATLSNTCEEFTGETIAETGSTIDFD